MMIAHHISIRPTCVVRCSQYIFSTNYWLQDTDILPETSQTGTTGDKVGFIKFEHGVESMK